MNSIKIPQTKNTDLEQKSNKSSLRKNLKKIDMFKQPVQLLLNKRQVDEESDTGSIRNELGSAHGGYLTVLAAITLATVFAILFKRL